MSHAIKRPLSFDGDSVSTLVGCAVITLICVRPGVYRVETSHRGPLGAGVVVDELSQSFAAEATARGVARHLYRCFHAGMSVVEVVEALAATAANPRNRPVISEGTDANHCPSSLAEIRAWNLAHLPQPRHTRRRRAA
jgi:hypothetical protein